MLLKIAIFLIPLVWLYAMYMFSAKRSLRELRTKSSRLTDKRLLEINSRLARAGGFQGISIRIHDIDAINGLAAQNGDIYLTRGLLDHYRSGAFTAEELSSVTAHELGHVALGHTSKRLAVFARQNAIRMALGMVLGRLIPLVGGYIADWIARLVGASFSRVDEFEADKYATALLIKTGIGAAPQKEMLRKLEEVTGRPAPGIAWLMHHPSIPRRIRAIEDNERNWNRSAADADLPRP